MPDGSLNTSPPVYDGHHTLASLFAARCKELGDAVAHREKDFGIWKSYSWKDYWDHAQWVGLGLRRLGLQRAEVISILSEDRREWLYCDMGVMGVGGITSGANVWAAIQQARILGRGKKVVTVICDSGLKYLQGDLYG